MTEITTLSVYPDVAEEVRHLRDTEDHENTSETVRELLSSNRE
jgi:hypothetical protein